MRSTGAKPFTSLHISALAGLGRGGTKAQTNWWREQSRGIFSWVFAPHPWAFARFVPVYPDLPSTEGDLQTGSKVLKYGALLRVQLATPTGFEPVTHSLEGMVMRGGCGWDYSGLRLALVRVVGFFVGLLPAVGFLGEFKLDPRHHAKPCVASESAPVFESRALAPGTARYQSAD